MINQKSLTLSSATYLKPGCVNPLRIGIGMINSPNIPKYAHYSTLLNYMYATKHSYDFIINRCPDDTDIDWKWDPENEYTSVWYKPEFIKKYLQYYHIFVFIDSDAYFKDIEKSVEDFLKEEDKNGDEALIYIAEDCKDKKICWTTGPNTGVIIAKNTPKTFKILDDWIKAPQTDLCKSWKYKHTREQGCLWDLKNAKYSKEIKIVKPATKLGTHDGDWIVHLAATSSSFRETYFGDIIKKVFYDNFKETKSDIDNFKKKSDINYSSINITNMICIILAILCILILFIILSLK